MTVSDGRRARGDQTRRAVAQAAARIATISGLDSITIGTLASETGVSKSGILTVFDNREAIQIAAVAGARQIYREAVIAPAWNLEPGRTRLLGLVDAWVDHLLAEVFPGGCFVTATSVEYGHRTGPVADSVRRLKREWLDLLEADLAVAGSADPAADAFRIDAFLTTANARRELFGDDSVLQLARNLAVQVIDAAVDH